MKALVAVMALALALAAASLPAAAAAAASGGRRLAAAPAWPFGSTSWPWTPPLPGSVDVRGEWEKTLALLWAKSKDSVGFCLGRSQYKAQRLMALSFPWPLPVGTDPADGLCSNRSRIDARLCTPPEVEQYYKFMLLTENPEKIPDNQHCAAGAADQPACSPGFFDAAPVRGAQPQQPHACCEGFFCPAELTCMIPCPIGAYCPRAWPAPPPDAYKGHGDAQWCAPYAYKSRADLGCGGADKWRIVPGSAFPTAHWPAGGGSIYCDGGWFCPNTTARLECTAGHFCRQGSPEPERCPPGAACPPRTEFVENNLTGVTVDALLFGLLWLAWMVTRQYNRLLRRLGARERVKITWSAAPAIQVVQAAPAPAQGSPGGSAEAETQAAASDGSSKGGRRGLLGFVQRRGGGRGAGSPSRSGQVWAAWQGPEAEAEGGYEPLLDEAQQAQQATNGAAHDAVELSPPPTRRPSHIHLVGAAPGLAGAASAANLAGHGRQESVDCEEELTPRGLHVHLLAQHRQSLLSSPLSSMHAGSGTRKLQLSVEFRGLGLRLRSCGKSVLQSVSGALQARTLTAIMGPSGAGKSSLLAALSGKAAAYGVVTGTTLVNGRPDRLERYKSLMGFVPQDDVMHTTLTVFENLLFSARFRLPAAYTRKQRLLAVERAITVLQLEDVRDSLIGDEETRGISGGQRKRVNVGLELVAEPSLLFLDEPTSGLDSTASYSLVAALHDISRSGVTAAAVVHQPSWPCCHLFDHLVLLGKGGRTVYYGAVAGAQPYFEGLGYEFSLQQNPADMLMDIVAGALLRPGQASASELCDAWELQCGRPATPSAEQEQHGELGDGQGTLVQRQGSIALRQVEGGSAAATVEEGGTAVAADGSELLGGDEERRSWRRRLREAVLFGLAYIASSAAEAWRSMKEALPQVEAPRWGARLFGRWRRRHGSFDGSLADYTSDVSSGAPSSRAAIRRVTPGFLHQFYWSLGRAMLKRLREPLSIFTDYAIFALTGMTLGLISDRGRETIMHFAVSITYSVVALGLMSTVGALPTFGRDRVVFFRESAAGLNRLAHFLALDTFDHAGTVMRSAVYFIMYYSFASPRAVIWQMLLVSIFITYCCTGMAYVLSQALDPSAAQLSAATLALINTLIARQGHARGLVKLAQTFSFARWGLEGYVIAESNRLTGVWLLARCADLQGLEYDVRRFGLCLLALFGLGLMFRVMALIAMLTLHRDKQR